MAPDGSVHIADTGNGRVRRAAAGLPGFSDADFSVPSEDGTEIYLFDIDDRPRFIEPINESAVFSVGAAFLWAPAHAEVSVAER